MVEGEAFGESSVFFIVGADGRVWYLTGRTAAEPLGADPLASESTVIQGTMSGSAGDRPI